MFASAVEISERPGEGLLGVIEARRVLITGRKKFGGQELTLPAAKPGLECLVFVDGKFAAVFSFHDAPRKDTRLFVDHLKPRHAVTRVMLVREWH